MNLNRDSFYVRYMKPVDQDMYANNGPFYLSLIDKPKLYCWYKSLKISIHTINSFMKSMKINSPLSEISQNKKITNHSAQIYRDTKM